MEAAIAKDPEAGGELGDGIHGPGIPQMTPRIGRDGSRTGLQANRPLSPYRRDTIRQRLNG